MAVELDEVDVKLLTALQADADCTNVELARLVGLSPAATLHRVRWLKESGVIRIISAQLDPVAAGFPLQLYVTATLARHDPHSSRVFDDQIRALPQIIAADNVAGEMDYLMTVVARDVVRRDDLGQRPDQVVEDPAGVRVMTCERGRHVQLQRKPGGLGVELGADDADDPRLLQPADPVQRGRGGQADETRKLDVRAVRILLQSGEQLNVNFVKFNSHLAIYRCA